MARLTPKAVSAPLLILIFAASLIPTRPTHVHAGELLVPDEWRQAHPGPYTITVALLVDEEWIARFGGDARKQAEAIVAAADRLFEPAGIHLRPVLYETWRPRQQARALEELLYTLERSHRGHAADMVAGLVAGYRGQEGGAARPRRPYVVVKHHPYRPDKDAYVLAHEIAHTLGLHHHACPDRRCIMDDHEYDPREHWCQEHLELLRANAAYFQYVLSPSA